MKSAISYNLLITRPASTLLEILLVSWACKFPSYVISHDLFDHDPILLTIPKPYEQNITTFKNLIRTFNNTNMTKLASQLANFTWETVISCEEPNCAYICFLNLFLSKLNCCFPLQTSHKSNKLKLKKYWMTAGLLKSFRTRLSLYKEYMAGKISKHVYTDYRNKSIKLIKIQTQNYYKDCFTKNYKNSTKIWDFLKSNLGSNERSKRLNIDIDTLNNFFLLTLVHLKLLI